MKLLLLAFLIAMVATYFNEANDEVKERVIEEFCVDTAEQVGALHEEVAMAATITYETCMKCTQEVGMEALENGEVEEWYSCFAKN